MPKLSFDRDNYVTIRVRLLRSWVDCYDRGSTVTIVGLLLSILHVRSESARIIVLFL